MIIRLFIIFALLFLSLIAGLYLHTDPGYVLVTVNQWSLETTLSVGVVCLMLLFFILHCLLLSLHWVRHIPAVWVNWRAKRCMQRAQNLQTARELMRLDQKKRVRNWVKKMPKTMRNDQDFIKDYALFLWHHQDEIEAEALLRTSLKTQFNEQLIVLYAQLTLDKKQISFIESLLKDHPHSAGLYLCLGRASLSHHLWGKARTYLEKSIECTPTPEAYAELGKLFTQLGDETNACDAYRKGLDCSLELKTLSLR